jgi:serine/threonine protein phosphatase PrpC
MSHAEQLGSAPLTLTAAGITDTGRRRAQNEDCFFSDAALRLFVVADGMGGHAAGAVASAVAIESLVNRYIAGSPSGSDAARIALIDGIRAANRDIRLRAQDEPDKSGMGTTVVALAVTGGRAVIANVGDSRAYISRDGTLTQITVDHSWVNEQIKAGLLTPGQARGHPNSSHVTRAVGTRENVDIDTFELDIRSGDVFLLCSDGLTLMIDAAQLSLLLKQNRNSDTAARKLVEAANRAGGADNVTVVVVEAVGQQRSAAEPLQKPR